jgi:hypothetical protein
MIALGDAPTWLAVIGAGITAWVALSQFARQTRQLERRQADEIDVVMVPSDVRLPGYPDMQHRPETWMVEVSNGSRRPV